MDVTKDVAEGANDHDEEGTATTTDYATTTTDEIITTIFSSIKRKISETLSPDAAKKKNEVGDKNTKATSPKCKKRITGKRLRKQGRKLVKSTPPQAV